MLWSMGDLLMTFIYIMRRMKKKIRFYDTTVSKPRPIKSAKGRLGILMPGMRAVFDPNYVSKISGPNVKKGTSKMDLAHQLIADIQQFKKTNRCDRLVMVWCGSTEKYQTQAPAHQSWAAFERGLQENSPNIS